MKRYLAVAVTTVFFLILMSLMVFFMLFRDTSSESGLLTSGDNPDGVLLYTENAEELFAEEEPLTGKDGFFAIPLQEGVKKEDIKIDDMPLDEMTLITIPFTDEDYYYKHNLFGSRDRISQIGFKAADGKVVFEIHTDGICRITMESDKRCMYIRYDDLHDIYDSIILVDPAHGGDDRGSEAYEICEKDLTLSIAEKLREPEDGSVGIYFTRTDDRTVSAEKREEYAEKLRPDLLITLHTNADDSTRITRGAEVYYNNDMLGQKAEKLADDLVRLSGAPEKNVVLKKKIPGFEDKDIPCIYVGPGFITNRSEALLMADDEYEEKAAKALEELF